MKRNIINSIFKNFSSLILAQFAYKAMTFISMIIIARYLGVEGFGQISFALSFVWGFLFLADFGFVDLFVRDISKKREDINKYVGNILVLKTGIGLLNILAIFILALSLPFARQKIAVIMVLGVSVVLDSFVYFYRSIFRIRDKMEIEAALMVLESAMKLISLILFIKLGDFSTGIIIISFALLLVSLLNFSINSFICFVTNKRLKFSFDRGLCLYLIRSAFPFALIYIFSFLAFRIDIIMLSYLKGDVSSGLFNANGKIIEQFMLISVTLAAVYLPLFSRLTGAKEGIKNILLKTVYILSALALGLILTFYFFGSNILNIIYGPDFKDASQYMFILSLVLLPYMLKPIVEKALFAVGRQDFVLIVYFIAVLANILLNFHFIPLFGIKGAIFSTLISESAATLVCFIASYRNKDIFRAEGYELSLGGVDEI
ncbi:MAG: flippase [Candidatus Omnitrophota bacterium]|jgi:O-antigen/teichoic acid export membrane protein|nr:MAG: flippase [Candidatus Omnitrophota bacterium]